MYMREINGIKEPYFLGSDTKITKWKADISYSFKDAIIHISGAIIVTSAIEFLMAL